MSKKIIYTKHIEKGRFYIRGDSKGGHPSLIILKNDRKNIYVALVFTSSKTPGTIRLKGSIDLDYPKKKYYMHILPYTGKRRDFGRKPLLRLRICDSDKQLIKILKKRFTDM